MIMDLSVIIVSFNVRHFLDQAISSVQASECNFDYEIIVVDNGSTDDSVEWVNKEFPDVQIYDLGSNLGFAKANNFAASKAKGEHILLLNPDTILQKDSLQVCYDFLTSHDSVGAVALRMFDGRGQYLPESKRGFPGPWTSFCKITGLNDLFPHSKIFNYYYLGHMSSDKDQAVDVLTGAFMMMDRRRYLDMGGLDEDFFMYGEDIDLCYRLNEAGYQNHYLASSSIIHFKGESTTKDSLHYIKTFYSAMSIYAGKHYNRHVLAILSILIQGAIYTRAGLAIVFQKVKHWRASLFSFLFIFIGLILGHYVTHDEWYLDYRFFLPPLLFTLLWQWWSLGDEHWCWWSQFKGWLIGSLVLAPMVISSSSPLWTVSILLAFLSFILQALLQKTPIFLPNLRENQKAGVFSEGAGAKAIKKLLDQVPPENRVTSIRILSRTMANNPKDDDSCREYIFDPGYFQWSDIVRWIIGRGKGKTNRILSRDRKTLITSRSKNESAILVDREYIERSAWSRATRKRRWHDIGFSLCILFLSPVISLVYGIQGVKKAIAFILSHSAWTPHLKATSSPESHIQGQSMTAGERRNIIDSRVYSFRRYQEILWQEFKP